MTWHDPPTTIGSHGWFIDQLNVQTLLYVKIIIQRFCHAKNNLNNHFKNCYQRLVKENEHTLHM